MLFSEESIRDPKDILNGWGNNAMYNPLVWESKIPSMEVSNFFEMIDPAYGDLSALTNSGYIEGLGAVSVVSAIRNCIARVGTTWGWYTKAIRPIAEIFKDQIENVAKIIDALKTAFTAVSLAIDMISLIPVAGWVIAIIKAVVSLIVNIVKDIQKANQAKRDARLAEQAQLYGLPTMNGWNPDIDTAMGRYLQQRLETSVFDLEWCFMPRYPALSASDFVAQHQKIKPNDSCFSGWLIWSKLFEGSDSAAPGLGFVPGTDSLHSTLQFATNRALKDNGDFLPVTRATAGQLWGQVVKGDSGMTFAVDSERVSTAWMEYISAAYDYGKDAVGAWTRISGRTRQYAQEPVPYDYIRNGFQYQCSPCDYGKRDCSKKKDGKWRSPDRGPGEFYEVDSKSIFLGHLHRMFQWETETGTKGVDLYARPAGMNEVDWLRTTAPVQALENLMARQKAMIQSPTCMYLDDSTSSDGSGQPRFRAMYKGAELHKLWDKCVTAMFESGDWKRIDYRDVIPGEEVDKSIRTMLSNHHNTTPEKFFNMENSKSLASAIAGTGKASLGIQAPNFKSVLGDPKPPAPPPLVELGVQFKPQRVGAGNLGSSGSGSSSKPSNAPLLLGAAALALLMLKK